MTILNNILAVSWREFRVMCTRYSILLVLSGGIFAYGLLYNYMYAPNVVRNAPVAVVDMSRTPLSRSYARMLDATPQARVLTNNADLPAAKELMKQDEVVGIVYIPEDFDARVGRGEEAVYVMYSTTTAFLYYASMQEASAGAMLAVNDDVRPEQVVFLPQNDIDPKDVEEIWDVIEDKCQNVVIKNGDLFRVCTYILKDAFAFHKNPGKALEKWKRAEAERVQQDSLKQDNAESELKLTADDTRKVGGIVSLLNQVGVETEDGSVVNKPEQVVADTVPTLYSSAPTTVVMTTPEAPSKVITPATTTGKTSSVESPIEIEELPSAVESLPDTDRLLVTNLLALNSFDEVLSFLEKGQREGKLIYGNVKTIKNPQASYLVIIKDKRLITVLNKGAKERTNLKTNTADALKNYKGHGVIWFQVF